MKKVINDPYVEVVISGKLYSVGFMDSNKDPYIARIFAKNSLDAIEICKERFGAAIIMGVKPRTSNQTIVLENVFTRGDFLSDSSLRFKVRRGMNRNYNSLLSKRKEKTE